MVHGFIRHSYVIHSMRPREENLEIQDDFQSREETCNLVDLEKIILKGYISKVQRERKSFSDLWVISL